jgi:phage recombination protein Bet
MAKQSTARKVAAKKTAAKSTKKSSTALQVVRSNPNALAIREYDAEALSLIKQQVAPEVSDAELAYFLQFCKVRKLSPFARQVYAIVRNVRDGDGWTKKMTLQTGIDGFRVLAERTGKYSPSSRNTEFDKFPSEEQNQYERHVKKWHRAKEDFFPPYCATAFVMKLVSGFWTEIPATVRWSEFVAVTAKGLSPMWEKMPFNQLEKCAEAKALRKAFPEDLGGMYVDAEMQQADVISQAAPQTPREQLQQDKKERATAKMKPSPEPNRGHGDEGFKRDEGVPQRGKVESLDVQSADIKNEQSDSPFVAVKTSVGWFFCFDVQLFKQLTDSTGRVIQVLYEVKQDEHLFDGRKYNSILGILPAKAKTTPDGVEGVFGRK